MSNPLPRLRRPARAVRLPVLAGALLALAGCGGGDASPEAAADTTAAVVVPVAVHVLAAGPATASIRAWGTVEPVRQARILSEVSGRVASTGAGLGDRVEAGRVLLEIDPGLHDARVRESEASTRSAALALEKAERDLDRAQALYDEGSISDSELEAARTAGAQAEASAASAEASLAQARKNLAAARLRAPFAGELASRLPDPGTSVSLGSPLAILVDIDRVRVEAAVSEEDLAHVARGGAATLTAGGVPGSPVSGVVTAVGPQADPESGQFPVVIEAENPAGHPLRGGMVVRCEIVYASYDSIPLLPVDALIDAEGEDAFYVVRNGRAERRTASLGPRRDQMAAVLAGAAVGDSVVVLGQVRLADGAPVRVEEVR